MPVTDPQVPELLAATPVSRTWRVAHGDSFAVLREDGPLARQLGLNRLDEPRVIEAAAAAGIGPRLLAADPDRGTLLTGWLPGRAWTAADLQIPGNLDRAGRLLRRLHDTPLAGPLVDLAAALERYAALASPALAATATVARKQLAALQEEGPRTGPKALCFCHNDPTPGNFIEGPGGDLRLIDWEYAGLGDGGFDLAGVSVGTRLDPDQTSRLLAAYLGREPTASQRRRHAAWAAFAGCLTSMWEDAVSCAGSPGG